MTTTESDYDSLLRSNLERVFNERDATKRELAVRELFVAEPVLYEPTSSVLGRAAIAEAAGKVQERFGPDFGFVPEGAAIGHHGFACLRWHARAKGRRHRRYRYGRRRDRRWKDRATVGAGQSACQLEFSRAKGGLWDLSPQFDRSGSKTLY